MPRVPEPKRPFLRVYGDLLESGMPPAPRAVLLQLMWHENHDTGQCNPSHARLARECGMSPRAVQGALNWLRDAGCISWKPGKTSNWYELHSAQIPPTVESQTRQETPTSVGRKRRVGSADSADELEERNQMKRTRARSARPSPGDAPLAGMPEPERLPETRAVDREDAGALVAVYIEGFRSTRGRDPDPAVRKRVAGSCAQIAKTRDTSDSWHDAKMAAWTAGQQGRYDVVAILADYQPPARRGQMSVYLDAMASELGEPPNTLTGTPPKELP